MSGEACGGRPRRWTGLGGSSGDGGAVCGGSIIRLRLSAAPPPSPPFTDLAPLIRDRGRFAKGWGEVGWCVCVCVEETGNDARAHPTAHSLCIRPDHSALDTPPCSLRRSSSPRQSSTPRARELHRLPTTYSSSHRHIHTHTHVCTYKRIGLAATLPWSYSHTHTHTNRTRPHLLSFLAPLPRRA